MPDGVDPHGARLVGVGGRVDAGGGEAFLEDRVREAQVGADAVVEGVVACCDVVVAPAELPGVCREDAGREAGFVGPCEERDGELVVVGHVELVEAGAGAVGFGDGFNRVAACCAETVGEIELFGDFGDGEFAERIVNFVYANWSEADWGRD